MRELPMVPAACSLSDSDLRTQIGRYREVGANSVVRVRASRRLVIAVGDVVPDRVVDELIDVERSCCPFFELTWGRSSRELSICVGASDHEPALAAIAQVVAAPESAT